MCVELATGNVRWSEDGYGPGNCILVGDTLVALSDAGELVLVEASPRAYRERARAKVLEGKVLVHAHLRERPGVRAQHPGRRARRSLRPRAPALTPGAGRRVMLKA